jgi:hypothetical protein
MTGLMSSTDSPAPITSYSSSTSLTFTLCMDPPRWWGVFWSATQMREQDRYGGNSRGFDRRLVALLVDGAGIAGVR